MAREDRIGRILNEVDVDPRPMFRAFLKRPIGERAALLEKVVMMLSVLVDEGGLPKDFLEETLRGLRNRSTPGGPRS